MAMAAGLILHPERLKKKRNEKRRRVGFEEIRMRKLGLGDKNGGEGARGPHARTHCPTLDFFYIIIIFYSFIIF
jgi:hypothetical protein